VQTSVSRQHSWNRQGGLATRNNSD